MISDYLTKQKKEELEHELVHLKTVVRPDISERLQSARAQGDLSENAEYHACRDEQGRNETRIQHIEAVLKGAQVIERSGGNNVELGATVVVQKVGTTDEKTFMIVDDAEADIGLNKISTSSPIGSAMVGKGAGEKFIITTPRGEIQYQILKIT